jgi:hypothetical protein
VGLEPRPRNTGHQKWETYRDDAVSKMVGMGSLYGNLSGMETETHMDANSAMLEYTKPRPIAAMI